MARRRPARELAPIPGEDATEAEAYGWLIGMGKLAEDGDERAAALLRESIRKRPDLWDAVGVATLKAGTSWRDLYGPDETRGALVRGAVEHEAERQRSALLAGSDDPVDKLLAGRIVACWLAVQYAEARYVQNLKDGATVSLLDLRSRELERANRSFLRAVESMERVRRLRGPRLAVNVGTVNVAAAIGPGMPTPAIDAGTAAALPVAGAQGEHEHAERRGDGRAAGRAAAAAGPGR